MRKTGFTLVELSIGLVIIGLLIGGILVGQNLIENARINRLINDLKQYEVAIIQFKQKFKQIPGESTYFRPPGLPDNYLNFGANGVNTCAAAPNTSLRNYENYQFWAHLSQSGMLSKNYAAFSPAGSCAGGIHNGSYEHIANAGVVWPYTELNPTVAANVGGAKLPIYANKFSPSASNSLFLEFYVNPLDVFALESKLGGQSFDYTGKQTGLVNINGVGNCAGDDGDDGITPCIDIYVQYGVLRYYPALP